MELLEVLERAQSRSADVSNLFSSEDGSSARRLATRLPGYKVKLARAAKFMESVVTGQLPSYILMEAMTTSDFPLLFGDILDRQVLATYTEWPAIWTQIAKRAVLNDFKDAKIFPPTWGSEGPLDKVPEGDQYPDAAIYEQTPFVWHAEKYGRTVPFSWESIINDDLDQLKNIPERLGKAARRTENNAVTSMYVDANGPHASLYTSGNKNQIITANGASVNNPALTIAGLQDAMLVWNNMVDEAGEPIMREGATLVVPPALEVVAENILNAIQIWITQAAGGGSPDTGTNGFQQLNVNNWMKNKLSLLVNPYIPLKATSAHGNTTWYIFANVNYSREAMRIGFLRGHETPEIWMKSPNAVRVGGGLSDPMQGDFDTDSITYKVRHVLATTLIDGKATVASNGSGS